MTALGDKADIVGTLETYSIFGYVAHVAQLNKVTYSEKVQLAFATKAMLKK